MQELTWLRFSIRLFFAFTLVFATFNPSGYSYFHWVKATLPTFTPYIALAGIALVIGWAMFIRATIRSLGPIGVILAALLQGCLVWLFIDLGWFDWQNISLMAWVGLSITAIILALGMSWSYIRRRLSGQIDTDDVADDN
ncbi:DUF6524 family protein [Marinagarivorans algicola]|uniref:DUF6524 family protein n=1 Tax=Marinagarivorans algicola TaxID=1513270 RepID=UPI0006B5163E|nr:DUF6524 family protein [Marinagarivorans algicola]